MLQSKCLKINKTNLVLLLIIEFIINDITYLHIKLKKLKTKLTLKIFFYL